MLAQNIDPDMLTKMCHFTDKYYRQPYPALEAVQYTGAGKYVLVTEALEDIGRGIALSWAKAGAAGIAICSRNAEDMESVVVELKQINPTLQVLAMACDTTRSSDVTRLFLAVREHFDQLDVVIANVGTAHLNRMDETDDNDEWWTDMTTNFRSTHLPVHQYIRTFGPAPAGTFISITSGAGTVVTPGLSSYGVAKQTDRRLIEFLNVEYPEMKAFSLDPGVVMTERTTEIFKPFAFDSPELVGMFSVWLGGGRADTLHGSYLHATWDIEELEREADDILGRGLLKDRFPGAMMVQEGVAWGDQMPVQDSRR
jgi:NAD(P)-dependent dehydrogenase (short-subunit alcohol dehydrogenase family)